MRRNDHYRGIGPLEQSDPEILSHCFVPRKFGE
jgi:hypothetical protein